MLTSCYDSMLFDGYVSVCHSSPSLNNPEHIVLFWRVYTLSYARCALLPPLFFSTCTCVSIVCYLLQHTHLMGCKLISHCKDIEFNKEMQYLISSY